MQLGRMATGLALLMLLVAGVCDAQCPNFQYSTRDREIIRKAVIMPIGNSLRRANTIAIFVAAGDKTFDPETNNKWFQAELAAVLNDLFRPQTIHISRRSRFWLEGMEFRIKSVFYDLTSLIPTDESTTPQALALDASQRVTFALLYLLECY